MHFLFVGGMIALLLLSLDLITAPKQEEGR
jgi:hypothetical protein